MFRSYRFFPVLLLFIMWLLLGCQPTIVEEPSGVEQSVENELAQPTQTPLPPTPKPSPVATMTAVPTAIPTENAVTGNERTKPRMVMFWSAY